MSEFISLSAHKLSKLLQDGQLRSVDLCKEYIERIERFEKDIKAWAYFDKKILIEKAEMADQYRKSGKPVGPLHGLPIAIKDIIGTFDMPTECGSKARKGRSMSQDSEIVNLLKISGAIIMGKTSTSEFAYFDPAETRNPHDYSRTPGGSSSGSAAAVASFMAPLSIGSQTGGSVIRPASYCGVVGFKPSFGLVSRNGVLRTSQLLDQIGWFSRNVEDTALLFKSLVKKDLYDSDTVHYSTERTFEVLNKKLDFEPKFLFYKTKSWKKIDKKSKDAFEFFLKTFKKNVVVEDTPSYFDDIVNYHKIIHETDLANNLEIYYKKFKKKLGKFLIQAIERGLSYSAKEYLQAKDFIQQSYKSYAEVFEDYYAILTPATTGVADKGLSFTGSPEFCKVWTYMGLPTISLPLLLGEKNLPLGIQMIGSKFDDMRLLSYAKWLEKSCK